MGDTSTPFTVGIFTPDCLGYMGFLLPFVMGIIVPLIGFRFFTRNFTGFHYVGSLSYELPLPPKELWGLCGGGSGTASGHGGENSGAKSAPSRQKIMGIQRAMI